jgi:hypothetical protein
VQLWAKLREEVVDQYVQDWPEQAQQVFGEVQASVGE